MSRLSPSIRVAALLTLLTCQTLGAGELAPQPDPETGLVRYAACAYIEAAWNDGDSFRVQLPSGQTITARLYQVDTIETSIHDTTAARRLRAQRRYFGISDYGETPRDSIEKAIEIGEAAAAFTREKLSQPFTLWTSHADARGSGDRVYVFIETAGGEALADCLVKAGLARAFGVYRQSPYGIPQAESIERMQDLELAAAAGRRGIWAHTDWDSLPTERLTERMELEELRVAMRSGPEITPGKPLDLNQADSDALQRLPGIGPTFAARIIEHRTRMPFKEKADLKQVSGIGDKTFASLEPLLTVSVKKAEPE